MRQTTIKNDELPDEFSQNVRLVRQCRLLRWRMSFCPIDRNRGGCGSLEVTACVRMNLRDRHVVNAALVIAGAR